MLGLKTFLAAPTRVRLRDRLAIPFRDHSDHQVSGLVFSGQNHKFVLAGQTNGTRATAAAGSPDLSS